VSDQVPLSAHPDSVVELRSASVAVLLAVLAAAVRGLALLGPQSSYWVLPAGFIVMGLSPYLFFRREGRRRAGSGPAPENPAFLDADGSRSDLQPVG
jgi:hypothetical protein